MRSLERTFLTDVKVVALLGSIWLRSSNESACQFGSTPFGASGATWTLAYESLEVDSVARVFNMSCRGCQPISRPREALSAPTSL
jgi:hypothetical protein